MTKSLVWWGVRRSCSVLWVELLIAVRCYEAAARHVRRMYASSPTERADMLAHLAWIEERRGSLDRAADYLDQALQVRPNDAVLNWEIGTVYQKLEKPSLALRPSSARSTLGPNSASSFGIG
jgi:tetratricopeptide (TPR) repeat protein